MFNEPGKTKEIQMSLSSDPLSHTVCMYIVIRLMSVTLTVQYNVFVLFCFVFFPPLKFRHDIVLICFLLSRTNLFIYFFFFLFWVFLSLEKLTDGCE